MTTAIHRQQKATGRRSLFGTAQAVPFTVPEMGARINRRQPPARSVAIDPDEVRVAIVGRITPSQRDALAAFYSSKSLVSIAVAESGAKAPISAAMAHKAHVVCLPHNLKDLAQEARQNGLAVIVGEP